MSEKTAKELAFIREHFVAPEWSSRFADLVNEHFHLPTEGKFLYVETGTGTHAITLREKLSKDVEMFAVDEHQEALNIAADKAAAVRAKIIFEQSSPSKLHYGDEEFSAVLSDASFAAVRDLKKAISELVRVTETDGVIGFFLPTSGSFGEFFSILWEALYNAQLAEHGAGVENLINELPTVEDVKKLAYHNGIDRIQGWTAIEVFDYESAEEFLNAPLVADFLLPVWMQSLPEEIRQKVADRLETTINEDRSGLSFRFTVKMTLITGKKSADF